MNVVMLNVALFAWGELFFSENISLTANNSVKSVLAMNTIHFKLYVLDTIYILEVSQFFVKKNHLVKIFIFIYMFIFISIFISIFIFIFIIIVTHRI